METAATAIKDAPATETAPGIAEQPSVANPPADETPDVERRKEVRLTLKIPVTLSWVDSLGESVEELTFTKDVSNSGCQVVLKRSLPEGSVVVCQNNSTRKAAKGKVSWSTTRKTAWPGKMALLPVSSSANSIRNSGERSFSSR